MRKMTKMNEEIPETTQEDYHLVVKYRDGLLFKFYPEVFKSTSFYNHMNIYNHMNMKERR